MTNKVQLKVTCSAQFRDRVRAWAAAQGETANDAVIRAVAAAMAAPGGTAARDNEIRAIRRRMRARAQVTDNGFNRDFARLMELVDGMVPPEKPGAGPLPEPAYYPAGEGLARLWLGRPLEFPLVMEARGRASGMPLARAELAAGKGTLELPACYLQEVAVLDSSEPPLILLVMPFRREWRAGDSVSVDLNHIRLT